MRAPPGEKPRRRGRAPADAGLLARTLREDRYGQDITSRAALPRRLALRAEVVAEGTGTLSGLSAAASLARLAGLRATPLARDGARVRPGETVLSLAGRAERLLAAERSLLNLLMHLSGVATMTERAVRAARRANPRFVILATRKTLPGLRDLEKQAVVDGGGYPNRRDLASGFLLKNTHLALVPLGEALRRVRRRARGRRIEVEVRSLQEAREAIAGGADQILVDNLPPPSVRRLLAALGPIRRRVFVEVSGGITPLNVSRYAASGADGASLGSLTHSAPSLPFHLRLVTPASPPS